MKNRFPEFISITGFLFLTAIACKHTPDEAVRPGGPGDPNAACDSVNPTFNKTVNPVLLANCVPCHNSTLTGGNIDLTKYKDIARIATSGQLMGTIEHKSGFSAMPKNGNKLTVCNIAQIRKWISDTTFATPPAGISCNPDTVYSGFSPMPKNGARLPDCYIIQIRKWIAQGMLQK